MGIRIIKPGFMTTVQDSGRNGYQSQGFSVSGVMDIRSFRIANLLLDNPENEAVLEFFSGRANLSIHSGYDYCRHRR